MKYAMTLVPGPGSTRDVGNFAELVPPDSRDWYYREAVQVNDGTVLIVWELDE